MGTQGPQTQLGCLSQWHCRNSAAAWLCGCVIKLSALCVISGERLRALCSTESRLEKGARGLLEKVLWTCIYRVLKPLFGTDTIHIAAKTKFLTMVNGVKK